MLEAMHIRRPFTVFVAAIALISTATDSRSAAAGVPHEPTPSNEAKGQIVRWIGAGGGFDPRSTQVSLEQDLILARNTLGADGIVLFAGGANAFGVQVLNQQEAPRSLVQRLGDLLDPQDGRNARFRRPRLKADGPATAGNVLAALSHALESDDPPLLLYVAAHGEMGESPRDNRVLLWSGTDLTVSDLAKALDQAPERRQVRVVVTSCYSGGFADIVFAGADPQRGAADSDRCGFFASQWDEVSSGCDPDPNRRLQQGYGMHFLQGLRSRNRDGLLLAGAAIDFDGDGRISLLEAHTRARLTSASIDVPTTTSERWLRQVAPKAGPGEKVALPEEDLVIATLGKELGVEDEVAARAMLESLTAHMNELKSELADIEKEESIHYEKLRVALLERWPVLDDPWHPLFQRYVHRQHASIESFLQTAPEVENYQQVQQKLDRLAHRYDRARLRAAILQRLVRAYENRALAARLRAAGGAGWERYARLLACERSFP
jgi:hypothetical protein